MNERIKELILKAGFPKFDQMYVVSDGEELEKFAELIVQKCITSILSLQQPAIAFEWGVEGTIHVIVDTIAEDFDMQHLFRDKK